jgi:hypothetical protein
LIAGTEVSLTSRDEAVTLKLSSRSFDGPDREEAFHELYGREILKVDIEPLQDQPIEIEILLRALPGLAVATATASPILCSHTTMMIDNDDPVIVINQSTEYRRPMSASSLKAKARAIPNSCSLIAWLQPIEC